MPSVLLLFRLILMLCRLIKKIIALINTIGYDRNCVCILLIVIYHRLYRKRDGMNILCRKTEIRKLKVVIIYVVKSTKETIGEWKWKIALSILSIKWACGFWCLKWNEWKKKKNYGRNLVDLLRFFGDNGFIGNSCKKYGNFKKLKNMNWQNLKKKIMKFHQL